MGSWARALERTATSIADFRAAPGARKRRGAACTHLLPDTSLPFPVNGCSSDRESGWSRLPGLGSGPQGAGGRVQSGRHVETCTGGRQGCVCTWCRSAGRTCRRKLRARRPLLPPPYKSLASKARRPMSARRRPHPAPASPPGRPPSPRTPRSSLSPSAQSVVALTPLPPRCSDCALAGLPRGEHPRGGPTFPYPRTVPRRHASALAAPPCAPAHTAPRPCHHPPTQGPLEASFLLVLPAPSSRGHLGTRHSVRVSFPHRWWSPMGP